MEYDGTNFDLDELLQNGTKSGPKQNHANLSPMSPFDIKIQGEAGTRGLYADYSA